MRIISKVDKRLAISPKRKFGNKKELVFELKAGKPSEEMPYEIAAEYIKSYPHVYKAYDPNAKETETTEEKEEEAPQKEFDPLEFLEVNHYRLEEALGELNRKEVKEIAGAMGLKTGNLKTERIIEKILRDVEAKSTDNAE